MQVSIGAHCGVSQDSKAPSCKVGNAEVQVLYTTHCSFSIEAMHLVEAQDKVEHYY